MSKGPAQLSRPGLCYIAISLNELGRQHRDAQEVDGPQLSKERTQVPKIDHRRDKLRFQGKDVTTMYCDVEVCKVFLAQRNVTRI